MNDPPKNATPPHSLESLPIPLAQQVDKVCDEFRQELRAGRQPRIEDYLTKLPQPARGTGLQELIVEELEHGRDAGQQLGREGYYARFPDGRDVVDAAFAIFGRALESTPALSQPDQSSDAQRPAAKEEPPKLKQIGRYVVRKYLGGGGFGFVYLGYDSDLDREVALKVPKMDRFSSEQEIDEFLQEARTAAHLDHPGIVGVHHVIREDVICIVQEYVSGGDLASRMRTPEFSVVPDRIADMLIQVAQALNYAHQQGVFHRDLKPSNILLAPDGRPRVADFGLALHESVQKFRRGERSGTPAYMSPEQVRREAHRVDGRSDIWSLGVILYESLTRRRPFEAVDRSQLDDEIQHHDPRPPRQINPSVPAELERICLKCLSKKMADRYATAADLGEDLRRWREDLSTVAAPHVDGSSVVQPSISIVADSGAARPRIVPKGLRSFDAEDADFFLDLLPGPRDRNGLPESIRFWKTRIEETDPDRTFSVGLIYGPSGCGKSSLVKAGLLPRLAGHVLPVYVEATPDDTEVRLLKGLRKHFPAVPEDASLPHTMASLREGLWLPSRKKLVVVLDQFEQWLHARQVEEPSQLIHALRHCDGSRVQTIVMVRDDFWMAVTRFLAYLEVDLLQGHNTAAVDRFDLGHAERVLSAFGRAYGALPDDSEEPSQEQEDFVRKSVTALSENGKVVCVRLTLFAEMAKGKPWTPATLREIGGVEGVGVAFLEETFSSETANPKHRLHQKAARAVLKALLPESGSDIKAQMRRHDDLLEASGYANRPKDFKELIRILDRETRLVTPTDPEGAASDDESIVHEAPDRKYYQLTHDYLVPSLREWLTRKQKETRGGRAEVRLAERSAAWNAKPEARHLPNVFEWINIRCLTDSKSWKAPQRKMMANAARVHATLWGGIFAALSIAGILVQQIVAHQRRKTDARNTTVAVDSIQAATGQAVPFLLEKLDVLPRQLVQEELQTRFAKAEGQQKLSLAYAMARSDKVEIDTLVAGIVDSETQPWEVSNIVMALDDVKVRALPKLTLAAASASAAKNWQAKARLAIVGMCLGDVSIAAEMLQAHPSRSARQPLRNPLAQLRQDLVAMEKLSPEQQNSPQVRLSRAAAHYYLDQLKEAMQDLDELVGGKSVRAQAWQLRALCLARQGSADEAEKAAAQLASASKSNKSYAASGRILTRAWLGRLDEANRQLEELVAENADDAVTQYNGACVASQLARICAGSKATEVGRLKRRALDLLRRAYRDLGYHGRAGIENDPDFAPLYDDSDFRALVYELAPPIQPWDPVQRTEFIAEFPKWSGPIEKLASMLQQTDISDVRSGMSLAIGSIDRPDSPAKEAWQKVLAGWYSKEVDSGTHSAAGWALRKWGCKVPSVEPTAQAPSQRHWWQTPRGLTLIRIPAGKLVQVDEFSRTVEKRTVAVAEFFLSDREISVGLFEQFMGDGQYKQELPEEMPKKWEGYDKSVSSTADHPVQQVSWYDAVMFCNWLSRKENRRACYAKTGKKEKVGSREYDEWEVVEGADGYRLPTDAQWEYACCAGSTTAYSCGDDAAMLPSYALYSAIRAEPCASKLCNAWGLFDMHGNVCEWCYDIYGEYGRGNLSDPVASQTGSFRVNRRGGWFDRPWDYRSSNRNGNYPSSRGSGLGFRVALVPSAKSGKAAEPQAEAGRSGGRQPPDVPCWSVGEVVYMRTRTKEILSPEDFAVFARLRELRKEIAQVEAVPVYTIFTNEQLAQIVQAKAATKGDLEKVAGVGDARIEKYGPRFLEHLRGQWRRTDEAGGQSV